MNKDTYETGEIDYSGVEYRALGERVVVLTVGETLTEERIRELSEGFSKYMVTAHETYKKELRKVIEGMEQFKNEGMSYETLCEIEAYNSALSSLLDNELLKIKE
jgi:MoaA/NifB/PqqE/SkfB family radical SAM enzyme